MRKQIILTYLIILIMCIGIAVAYNGDFCNETYSPCGGGCNSTDLSNMFDGVTSFDTTIGNISGWNTSCIINMNSLFANSDFNQSINNWDTSQVQSTQYMFAYNIYFNQPLDNWDTSQITDMAGMFNGAVIFNQPINSWDVSNVTNMDGLFSNTNFSQELNNWDTSQVQYMQYMFTNNPIFNKNIGNWNTSNVVNMEGMFSFSHFQQDISGWDTSQVTLMDEMFYGNNNFNYPIGSWDTSQVTLMYNMFNGGLSFDRDIGTFKMSSVTDVYDMMTYTNMTSNNPIWNCSNYGSCNINNITPCLNVSDNDTCRTNYDRLLIGWANQTLTNNLIFHGGYSQYTTDGLSARNDTIIGIYNWTITDGGLKECSFTGNLTDYDLPCSYTGCEYNYTRIELEPCQLNDTQRIEYLSSNESCNASYNTTEACNYCDANIIINYSECTPNGTQNITYIDLNLTTCCYMTGLISDCSTQYYPYNETYTQSCTYYINDFNCTLDNTPVLNDKINVICELPNNNYCCVINTYQNNNLLATSPEYKNPISSFFSINPQSETRSCFPVQNQLLNGYYTQKELRTDTNYTIEVLCSDNITIARSQKQITPTYHTPDWIPHRLVWIGNNPLLIITIIIVIIGAILLMIYIIQKARG